MEIRGLGGERWDLLEETRGGMFNNKGKEGK